MTSLRAKSFTRDGGGTIATTDDHKPPTRSSSFSDLPPALKHRRHTTRNLGGYSIAVLRNKIAVSRPAWLGHAAFGFCAAHEPSRTRLARTRHHRRQSSIIPEFWGVAEFRCPGPTPSNAASPVFPSRHHTAGYGQLPPGPRFAKNARGNSKHMAAGTRIIVFEKQKYCEIYQRPSPGLTVYPGRF